VQPDIIQVNEQVLEIVLKRYARNIKGGKDSNDRNHHKNKGTG
jgi:hypothetical protein